MKAALSLASLLFAANALAQTVAPAPQPATSQPSAAPIAFDAVSIKPNHSGSPAMVDRTPPDGYSVENFLIRAIIGQAFSIRYDLITGGPGWLDSDHYDLTAKVAGDDLAAYKALTKDQRNRMLQAVLTERFHLVTHTVTKQLPGYTLTIAKNGPKLQPAKPGQQASYGANYGDYDCEAMPISTLAELLSEHLQQTVLDQTGLTGKYTFELKWAWDGPGARTPAANEASEPSGLPALPTALEEQLGLKLIPTKLPTTTLVIDSAQPPTPN